MIIIDCKKQMQLEKKMNLMSVILCKKIVLLDEKGRVRECRFDAVKKR